MVFEMNAKTVRRSLENGPQDPKPPGRHDKIEDEKEEIIINEILRLEDEYHPMREKEILKFIKSKFFSDLTRGWFNCFFVRHIKRLKKCHSIPQQDTRLSVPREFLFQHLINMREIVENRIAELVLNLDEVGVSEWEDKKPFKVIVSRRNPNKTFEHAVSRNNTHVTLVACIAASGASLAPLLICKNKVRNSFWESGVCENDELIIHRREPPYINESLLLEYIKMKIIPYVEHIREKIQKPSAPAVLMMDSCSSHCTDNVLKTLG